jgi:hypothetical protein
MSLVISFVNFRTATVVPIPSKYALMEMCRVASLLKLEGHLHGRTPSLVDNGRMVEFERASFHRSDMLS